MPDITCNIYFNLIKVNTNWENSNRQGFLFKVINENEIESLQPLFNKNKPKQTKSDK